MTFTQIKTRIMAACNLTSTDADTRVGISINQHYRRITSLLGLGAARFVTRSASMTVGVRTVTFTEIEKIDRVIDVTDSTAIRLLAERSVHELRSNQPRDAEPSLWALQNTDADSVVIITDTVPQSAYSLQADGWTTLSDLSGSDEPIFPESFHDILTWFVISEELLRKEKERLALAYEQKAEKLLADLRFHLADSPTQVTTQASHLSDSDAPGGGGGGGGNLGGTNYTQTGLITFDRDPSAPFAVTASSAKVDNLNADKVDGVDIASLTADRVVYASTTTQLSTSDNLGFDGTVLRVSTTAGIGGSESSATKVFINGGVQLNPLNSGPNYGGGICGIAYRNTGEDIADPALVIRAEGYLFETLIGGNPEWAFVIASNGRVNVGQPSSGSFTPASRFEVSGNVAIGSTYAGATAGPTDGLLVEGKLQVGLTEAIGKVAAKAPATGSTNGIALQANGNDSFIEIFDFGGTAFAISPSYQSTGAYRPLYLQTSGQTRLQIETDGDIGVGGSPATSAIFDVASTTKGFLPPRMTSTQRDNIASPTAGLVIYNTTTNKLNVYTTAWEAVTSA